MVLCLLFWWVCWLMCVFIWVSICWNSVVVGVGVLMRNWVLVFMKCRNFIRCRLLVCLKVMLCVVIWLSSV